MSTSAKSSDEGKPKLIVRNARLEDIATIQSVYRKVYSDIPGYSEAQLRGQMLAFPMGQFVAVYEGQVVGYCATFRISEHVAFQAHDWMEITGGGFASRHESDGDWLYGMEVFVDPQMRGARIGQRLYNERKALCTRLGLAPE